MADLVTGVRVQALAGTSAAQVTGVRIQLVGPLPTGLLAPLPQAITFAIPDHYTTDAPFALAATAGSGLPVSYTVTAGAATVAGNTVTLGGTAGIVTITANQAGNEAYATFQTYDAAPPVSVSFNVDLAPQTITFPGIPGQDASSAPFALAATASSGLPVSYAVTAGPATVAGDVVTFTGGSGFVSITATQAGNGTYAPAPPVVQVFGASMFMHSIVSFVRTVEIEGYSSANAATLAMWTDQPGAVMAWRESKTIQGMTGPRNVWKFHYSGNSKGRLWRWILTSPGVFRLFRAKVYTRTVGGDWHWIELPVERTADEWQEHKLPIEATTDDWQESKLPIDPTSDTWESAKLPIDPTSDEWHSAPLPIDPTSDEWQSAKLPIDPTSDDWQMVKIPWPPTPDIYEWVDVPVTP